MTPVRKIVFLWLWCSLVIASGQAQKIYSEAEINQERLFLEAYEKKILGKFDEAIALYEKVYEQSPTSYAAAFELARIYDQQRQPTEAIKWMKLAQSGDPENIHYQEFLAEMYQSSSQFVDAAKIYESLAKKDEDSYYYYRWAYFLVRADKIDEAIKVYDELEKTAGVNEEIIRRKHSLYLGLGDNKKAARELEKLIADFPESTDYYHLLAAFYEQIGEKKEARTIYEKILRLDPDNAEAQMALAGRSASSNSDLQYLGSLVPAFEQPSVEIDLKISKLLPFIQKVADNSDPALADAGLELTSILERVHPNDAKGFAASGDLLFYSGRLPEARDKYQQTLELDESVYTVWEQLAMTYILEGDFENLLKVSNNGIDLFPNKAQLYYFNGVAALQLGQYQDAQRVLDQAVLMSGKDVHLKQVVLGLLGEAYTALEDYVGADRVFAEALELDQQSPEILSRQSLSLSAREGTQQRALQLAEQALKKVADYPLALQAQGMALYQAKEYEKAKTALQKALDKSPGQPPQLLENYGDVLFQLGEADEALNYWQKARDQGRQTKTLDSKINNRKI